MDCAKHILRGTIMCALTFSPSVLAETARPVPHAPKPSALPAGLNVLMIGDSNTEIGHITGELARMFEENYGYFGSGYHSLYAQVGMGSGYLPYLNIENQGAWTLRGMVKPGAPKPYLAPDGTYAVGMKKGLETVVEFYGTTVDVHWLATEDGGAFSLAVAGRDPQTVNTAAENCEVRKTSVDGLDNGWHRLVLTTDSPPVTLLGVEARVATPSGVPRAVVHKWGKGWATTQDFRDVDPMVFQQALGHLRPDVTVIILGTNDHNLAGHNRDEFADNLREIVGRIKTAVPNTRVLVLSTAVVNSAWSNKGLDEYREILPELCAEVGAHYWDMSAWLGGPWSKNNEAGLMQDGVHVNAAGGEKIAGQLYEEVLRIAQEKPGAPQAQPTAARERVVGELPGANSLPLRIDGLSAWWSAKGPVAVDEDGSVLRWLDLSGNGVDAVVPWPTSRPQYVADGAGDRPLLRFDGKSSHLRFPMREQAQTIFVVFRARHLILGHPYFNSRPFHPGVVRPRKAFSANYAAKAVTGGRGFLNGRAVHVGDNQDDALEFDDGQLQVFSLVLDKPVPFSYFGWGGSWNFDKYISGDVAEMLVYDRALNDEERQALEKEMATRWGIAIEQ